MSYRQEKMQVVSVLDPAIDVKRMGWEALDKYMSTRDIELIRPFFKSGERPAIYHLKEVPQELWERYVMDGVNEQDRYKRALMCALTNVEHMRQRDGTTMGENAGGFVQPGQDIIPPATIARIAPALREEIGRVAYEHSFFEMTMSDCFLLPPSLAEPLVARMRASDPAAPSSPSSPAATPSEPASPASASTP